MADNEREGVDSDAAGVGPYARDTERLVALSDLDGWDIAEGEPDIRGWEVRTVSGRVIGEIKELLVDPDAREVVLLDVDLSGTDEHAQVPIRVAEVDRERRVVRVDSADLRPMSEEAAAAGTVAPDELPVPPAITPAEVERRAEIVTGKSETELERENQRDYEREKRLEASNGTDYERDREINREAVRDAERRAKEENRVRYGRSKEVVVERRPVVVEETVVRRRAVDGSEAADETLQRRKDDVERPEDRL